MKISLGASQAAKVLEINSVFNHGGGHAWWCVPVTSTGEMEMGRCLELTGQPTVFVNFRLS